MGFTMSNCNLSSTIVFFMMILNGMLMISMAEANVHYYEFTLKEKNYTRVCGNKSMLVVNEQFPGPTLYVNKGDTMYVNVHNEGNYGVTIHWHGVKQPRNPWSDGPEYITQCPIQPKTNFTYEVIFSEEEGTLWWHAHSQWTRNSVHGAIVINPAEGTMAPYATPYAEQLIIIGSWYTYDVNIAVEVDLESGNDLPTASCFLLNGQPGDFSPCSNETTFRWKVEYGKTYLLRLLNAAMNDEQFFGIAGHSLTIVGMDGAYLKPFETPYVMLTPGQTADVLVTANWSTLGQYYMMAREFKNARNNGTEYISPVAVAILDYETVNTTTTATTSDPSIMMPDNVPMYMDADSAFNFLGKLKSLADEAHRVDVPLNITTAMFITLSLNLYVYDFDTPYDRVSQGSSMNNVSWVDPGTDVLQAYYRNISGIFTEDFPDDPPAYFNFTSDTLGVNTTQPLRGTKVKMLNYNEQVEITYQATNVINASEDHPMHLHGHSFYIVGFGYGVFDPVKDPLTYNLVDPPYVNTHSVPKNGWMTLRFRANNPGVWLWHCHMDKHLSWGMNTVFIVKDGDTLESTMRDPPSYMPNCTSSSSILVRGKSDNLHMDSK